jgi:hypothetical protein
MKYTLNRIATIGDFAVYQRGAWARRERIPKYLVSRESDGRDLEDFRRKQSAMNWARQQAGVAI